MRRVEESLVVYIAAWLLYASPLALIAGALVAPTVGYTVLLLLGMLALWGVYVHGTPAFISWAVVGALGLFVSATASLIVSPHVFESFAVAVLSPGVFVYAAAIAALYLAASMIGGGLAVVRALLAVLILAGIMVFVGELVHILILHASIIQGWGGALSSSLIGSWSVLGPFGGALACIALGALVTRVELAPRSVLFVSLATSLSLLFVAYNALASSLLAVAALGFGYFAFKERRTGAVVLSLAVCVLLASMHVWGDARLALATALTTPQPIEIVAPHREARVLTEVALSLSPLVGFGPQSFAYAWTRYREAPSIIPPLVDVVPQTSVAYAYDLIIELGILGAIAFLSFVLMVLYSLYVLYRHLSLKGLPRRLVWLLGITFTYVAVLVLAMPESVALLGVLLIIGVAVHAYAQHYEIGGVYVLAPRALVTVLMSVCALILLAYLVVSVSADAAVRAQNEIDARGATPRAEALVARARALPHGGASDRAAASLAHAKIVALIASTTPSPTAKNDVLLLMNEALGYASDAIAKEPLRSEHWVAKAHIYHTMAPLAVPGAFNAAVSAYDKALELQPKSLIIPLERALLDVSTGQTVAAQSKLVELVKRYPEFQQARVELIKLLGADGNFVALSKELQALLVSAPTDARAWYLLGIAETRVREYAQAEAAFGRALALEPTLDDAALERARMRLLQGQAPQALTELQEYARGNATVRVLRAISRLQSGATTLE